LCWVEWRAKSAFGSGASQTEGSCSVDFEYVVFYFLSSMACQTNDSQATSALAATFHILIFGALKG